MQGWSVLTNLLLVVESVEGNGCVIHEIIFFDAIFIENAPVNLFRVFIRWLFIGIVIILISLVAYVDIFVMNYSRKLKTARSICISTRCNIFRLTLKCIQFLHVVYQIEFFHSLSFKTISDQVNRSIFLCFIKWHNVVNKCEATSSICDD